MSCQVSPFSLESRVVKKRKPGFDEFYSSLFPGRWPALREALTADGSPSPFAEALSKPYFLDAASVSAARALGPTGDSLVLDLCAAPGGKTLVLASSLGPGGRIVANERSGERRRRLRAVLDEHLPPPLRERVCVTGHDAARWGLHEQDRYDLVLLDAPCSSERHLIRDPVRLAAWSPARSRNLALRAYAMLLAALQAVKPGGRVLYSTCALAPGENDEVVRRALARRPGLVRVLREPEHPGPAPGGPVPEATEYGHAIWPDTAGGAGPIYYALLEKIRPSGLA